MQSIAGKSSFLNTLDSALRGVMSRRADVGVLHGGTSPMTRRLIKHTFVSAPSGSTAHSSTVHSSTAAPGSTPRQLGFCLWDAPGWSFQASRPAAQGGTAGSTPFNGSAGAGHADMHTGGASSGVGAGSGSSHGTLRSSAFQESSGQQPSSAAARDTAAATGGNTYVPSE